MKYLIDTDAMTIVRADGTVTPPVVPPVQPPVVPPMQPPATPPAPPIVPPAGALLMPVWDLREVILIPVPPATGSEICLPFVADAAKYPRGILLKGIDEHQPTIPKDFVVSAQPFSFVPVTPAAIHEGAGTYAGPLNLRFGATGVAKKPYDVLLLPGQAYYINIREYKAPGDTSPRGPVWCQFACQARTD